jgi:hypothetical protein
MDFTIARNLMQVIRIWLSSHCFTGLIITLANCNIRTEVTMVKKNKVFTFVNLFAAALRVAQDLHGTGLPKRTTSKRMLVICT